MSFFSKSVQAFLIFVACASMSACMMTRTTGGNADFRFLNYESPLAGTALFKHRIDARFDNGKNAAGYVALAKWDQNALTLIATGDMGRLCKIVLKNDNSSEQFAAAFLPEEARKNLHFALRDFQFIFYSPQQIADGGIYRAEENDVPATKSRSRKIFENGEPLLTINYSPADVPVQKQTISVVCHKWHYDYSLSPID
ncbi:MAG: DUF3261 domain-containing protein [Opitutales bacterium]|nr:DUF3261 domain-containing protein [Opitutales bacterium]